MTTTTDYATLLRSAAAILGEDVLVLTNRVLDYPGFVTWSGGLPGRHHYGAGGLLKHTYEVVTLCMHNWELYHNWRCENYINPKVLFLAAVWHDIGKVHDYVWREAQLAFVPEKSEWVSQPHHRLIHHINRSAILWCKAVHDTGLCKDIEDDVLHCILSHHGTPQMGSAVTPKTRAAWMLHLCDSMSAFMDGIETMKPVGGGV